MSDLPALITPDETALQLYARNYVEPVETGIFFCQTVIPGQIIEICGRSGSGKTTFLLQVDRQFSINLRLSLSLRHLSGAMHYMKQVEFAKSTIGECLPEE